jgi:hypothetical protein
MKYLGGKALECVSVFDLIPADDSYLNARQVLDERFGSEIAIANSFRDKLEAWSKIPASNGDQQRQYADFLRQCVTAKRNMRRLTILDDPRVIQDLVKVLPGELIKRWSRVAGSYKRTNNDYPEFEYYSEFVVAEAELACDDVTSIEAIYGKSKPSTSPKETKSTAHTSLESAATSDESSSNHKCQICKSNTHELSECRTFAAQPFKEKQEFVRKLGLCFGCLVKGHTVEKCKARKQCKKCNSVHATCFHFEKRPSQEHSATSDSTEPAPLVHRTSNAVGVICGKVDSTSSQQLTSMIIPVYLSTVEDPSNEQLVYALVDSQSDTSFVLNSTIQTLKGKPRRVKLQIATMTSKTQVTHCDVYNQLQIRGYYSNRRISIPETYSRDFIPVNKSHVPTAATAESWPPLCHLRDRIPKLLD